MQRQHAVVVLGSASRPGASQGLLRGVPAAAVVPGRRGRARRAVRDRKSTRLNSSHLVISYAVFCLKKKKKKKINTTRSHNSHSSSAYIFSAITTLTAQSNSPITHTSITSPYTQTHREHTLQHNRCN